MAFNSSAIHNASSAFSSAAVALDRAPPHLLFLAYPAQGHILPLFNLAKLLSRNGLAISFLCVHHRITALHRFHAPAAPRYPLLRLLSLPERVPISPLGIDGGVAIAPWTKEVAQNMEQDFFQLVQDLRSTGSCEGCFSQPPCGVVFDIFLWWGHSAVVGLNLKPLVFFVCSATALCVLLNLPRLISEGYAPLRTGAEPKMISLPGLEPTLDVELLHFLRDHLHKDAVQPVIDSAFAINESSCILVNACYGIEADAIDAARRHENARRSLIDIFAVGPLLPPENLDLEDKVLNQLHEKIPKQEENECLSWLDSQPPESVVYVAFGTIFIPSFDDMSEIARGLEASGHRFLWVLRLPTAMTTTGDDHKTCVAKLLPEGFQSRTKDRGFIVSTWAPQLSILSHPATGGFLSHCGSSSTAESIFMGVPVIACPQFADQDTSCRLIVRQWKVGVQLEADEISKRFEREAVERAVKRVMEGEERKQMKENAMRLRGIVRSSMHEGGSSFKDLEAFVQKIFEMSLSP